MSHSIVRERYEIQECLSDKGSRQTFLAVDLSDRTPVVLKILLFGRDFQWQDHKLFERGANALKALSHPRIPRYLDYFDFDTDKDRGFVQVQSYIPARSLQQHLEAGRTFSELEMRQLARDLLEILIYLHSRQPAVIHRDIKPSNILLGDRSGNRVGEVFLVGFDSVQTHGSAQPGGTMTIVGTYGYMPPEQFGGKAYPASDLYSLGATLIAIATGKHPSDLPQKNLRIDFERETNLSLDFTNWLKWLVEPSLDMRLSAARYALQMLDDPSLYPERFQANPPAIGKPNDSRIILHQKQDTLHLVIPASGLTQHNVSSKTVYIFLFVIGFPAFIFFLFLCLVCLALAFSEGVELLFACIILLIPTVISFGFMFPLLKCFLGETHLKIDPVKILLYKSIMIRVSGQKALRRDLLKIYPDTNIINRYRVLLMTRDRTFQIPTTSPRETAWLAEELSQ
ncbi:MAG: serine/threonine protein kinase, partial [Spirulina sp.]